MQYEILPKLRIYAGGELSSTVSIYRIEGSKFESRSTILLNGSFSESLSPGYTVGFKYAFSTRWEMDFRFVSSFMEPENEWASPIFFRTFMISQNCYFGELKESEIKEF